MTSSSQKAPLSLSEKDAFIAAAASREEAYMHGATREAGDITLILQDVADHAVDPMSAIRATGFLLRRVPICAMG